MEGVEFVLVFFCLLGIFIFRHLLAFLAIRPHPGLKKFSCRANEVDRTTAAHARWFYVNQCCSLILQFAVGHSINCGHTPELLQVHDSNVNKRKRVFVYVLWFLLECVLCVPCVVVCVCVSMCLSVFVHTLFYKKFKSTVNFKFRKFLPMFLTKKFPWE